MVIRNKKDRRPKLSTVIIFSLAFCVGIVTLYISYLYAWTELDKQNEARASTDVFRTMDLETFSGDSLTADDLKGTGLIAFNVWETT